jgi:hypothetical protein
LPTDLIDAPAGEPDDSSPTLDTPLCWTQYLREQELRRDNLCKGLIALASPPIWPSGWSAMD